MIAVPPLAGTEPSSALQRGGLAQVVSAHKRHLVAGDLQSLTRTTYRRTKLLESDRLLAAELRSAPAGVSWLNHPQAKEEIENIRYALKRSRPYGSEPWVAKAVARLGLENTIRNPGHPEKGT